MKAKSTMPFNAMGVISPEAGMFIETENEIIFAQLENMGFIESLEGDKTEAKRAKKK